MKNMILPAANKTALKLLIQILIGFILFLAWDNHMMMTYWLIFALAKEIFINEYYNVMAKELQKIILEGKKDENPKSE